MGLSNIENILQRQEKFFSSNKTLDVSFRITQLKRLKQAIKSNEKQLFNGLSADLGKSEFEAFTNEIGLAYKEISRHIRKLKTWSRPKRVSSPIYTFTSSSYITQQPYGKVLIIGPFNFPFMLTIIPLIGAVSAGNVVVIKPSENTVHTSGIIEKLIGEAFGSSHVAYVQGGVETSQELLSKRWDKIFFTGSTRVGKIVMQAAAKNLTPVELELGGKNPVVVDKDANLRVAAKRIAWGKFLNAGQSCVSPDYLFVHEDFKDKFLPYLKEAIETFYSEDPEQCKDFGRIIDESTIDRLSTLIKNETIYWGGKINKVDRYFSPTILSDVAKNSEIMKDEIFGPVLPVLTFKRLDDVIRFINRKEKPLALYFFSENRKRQKEFLKKTFSGDASINDVVIHFTNFALPFGGVGYSGMGNYHGKHSFDCFSHKRSVMKTPTFIDISLRYPPAKKWVLKVMRFVFR